MLKNYFYDLVACIGNIAGLLFAGHVKSFAFAGGRKKM